MEKNKSIEELELKRDVCRLVLDIHTFLHISDSKSSIHLKNIRNYVEFMHNHSGFEEQLANIVSRAQEYGCNPNNLFYDDELYRETTELLKNGTEEEKNKIRTIDAENSMARHICGNPSTLSEVLIDLFKRMQKCESECPIEIESLKKYISLLIKNYTEYVSDSIEYDFLMETDSTENWFLSCFDSYFFTRNLSRKQMTIDLGCLIVTTLAFNSNSAFSKLKRAIASYGFRNVPISEEYMIILIESVNEHNIKHIKDIMRILKQQPHICPFTAEEYLESLFGDLINKKLSEKHNLILTNRDNTYNTDNITNLLRRLFIPLANLSADYKAFVSFLAQKIALLDDSLEISSRLCAYIEQCQPDFSSVFIDAYFRATDELTKSRTNLVITLHQIKNQKTKE